MDAVGRLLAAVVAVGVGVVVVVGLAVAAATAADCVDRDSTAILRSPVDTNTRTCILHTYIAHVHILVIHLCVLIYIHVHVYTKTLTGHVNLKVLQSSGELLGLWLRRHLFINLHWLRYLCRYRRHLF